jgi:hypothetical protein
MCVSSHSEAADGRVFNFSAQQSVPDLVGASPVLAVWAGILDHKIGPCLGGSFSVFLWLTAIGTFCIDRKHPLRHSLRRRRVQQRLLLNRTRVTVN